MKRRKLVFPRYHQLDVVRQLLADAKANGVGQRYLIQHSTGSGKSNSITWLSHQLVELTDATATNPVFDSVIVVTDRVILDKQIRDNIKQFAQVKGVVQAITQGSKQLRQALEAGKKLIITTVDKFSYVFRDLKSLSAKRFAIIIDEAHSSQSGSKAAKMSAALSGTEPEDDETIKDKILRIIEEQKLSSNASYYAFTATVTKFIRLFLENFGRDQLDPVLNECVQIYKDDLDENQKVDFKVKAKSFIRNYQFLIQICTFRNPYWESLRTFLKFLLPKLPLLNEGDLSYGVLESVDMDSYRVAKQTAQAILLEDNQELTPTPPEPAGRKYQPNIDFLSNIIQEFNQRFGNVDWTDRDRIYRLYFEDIPRKILEDEEYQNAKKYSDRQNTFLTFQKKYVDNFQDVIYDDEEAYRQFSDDQELREFVLNRAFELEYDQGVIQGDPNERRADDQNNPAIRWRGSKAGDLLRFARTWAGNDLKECLQAVYDNRSEAEF